MMLNVQYRAGATAEVSHRQLLGNNAHVSRSHSSHMQHVQLQGAVSSAMQQGYLWRAGVAWMAGHSTGMLLAGAMPTLGLVPAMGLFEEALLPPIRCCSSV